MIHVNIKKFALHINLLSKIGRIDEFNGAGKRRNY